MERHRWTVLAAAVAALSLLVGCAIMLIAWRSGHAQRFPETLLVEYESASTSAGVTTFVLRTKNIQIEPRFAGGLLDCSMRSGGENVPYLYEKSWVDGDGVIEIAAPTDQLHGDVDIAMDVHLNARTWHVKLALKLVSDTWKAVPPVAAPETVRQKDAR